MMRLGLGGAVYRLFAKKKKKIWSDKLKATISLTPKQDSITSAKIKIIWQSQDFCQSWMI